MSMATKELKQLLTADFWIKASNLVGILFISEMEVEVLCQKFERGKVDDLIYEAKCIAYNNKVNERKAIYYVLQKHLQKLCKSIMDHKNLKLEDFDAESQAILEDALKDPVL